uniref:Short-chain dehydrogenase/reductase SDR n=1 Tax=Dechloromonas aromatica (strain RCB) TaxID=159087 RepID=Q47GC5_DECAR
MKYDFLDQVFVVSGGGSGIGHAVCLALGAAGARVVIGNRNIAQGEDVAHQIALNGGHALFRQTNVANAEDCKALVDLAVREFGELHGAFNNAGTQRDFTEVHETPDEDFSEVIDINLKGTCYLMKYEIASFLRNGRGSIVNTSSIFGLKAMPKLAYYVASKHGIVGLTRAAALDYADRRIRVNALCPGPIKTPSLDRVTGGDDHMYEGGVPMRRIGTTEEVAAAALWLLSDESRYVTGTCLSVDGGMVAA